VRALGILSALVVNIALWGVIAVFVTVGLAAAHVRATTFYVTWAFFVAVIVVGAFLTIKWGKEGRRWLWRISLSWTFLFLITLVTLGLAPVALALLSIHPGFRRWLSYCLVPPPADARASQGQGS
jgi:membrane protease YdiL (CAAX protease family)